MSRFLRGIPIALFAGCVFWIADAHGAATPPPSTPPFDSAAERMTEGQLIDRLQSRDMSCLNGPDRRSGDHGFAPLDGGIDLSAPDGSIRIWCPELRELVRRGVAALPALLEHVSDARPTRLVFAVRHGRSDSKPTVTFGDTYDSRVLPAPTAMGVNTKAHVPVPVEHGYTVKLGDLCYVAIGQIVNRRLFVFSYTDSGFDEHGRYKSGGVVNGRPFGFSFVYSPAATPVLATAVRADWTALTARAHADSLRADVKSERNAAGALVRLFSYYPADGTAEIHAAIKRVLDDPGEVKFWNIDHMLSSLAPFEADDLQPDLTALMRKAVRQDRRFQSFEDTRKNPLATGTASIIATSAALLIHRGADTRVREVVTDEVERLRQQQAEFDTDGSGVYAHHLGRLEAVLRALDGVPELKTVASQGLSPRPAPRSLKVALGKVQGVFGRWPMFQIEFAVSGVPMSQVTAARIGITEARDDTGFSLVPSGGTVAPFVHSAVGRTDDAVLHRNDPPSLKQMFSTPPGVATRLVTLVGYVDLVVPGYDEASVLKFAHVTAAPGAPLASSALAAAHATITVFDAQACNEALSGGKAAPDGPRLYGAAPHFHGPPPPGAPANFFKEPAITDRDIALGIDDPDGAVVSIEFVGPEGQPLQYNHNGWYHASNDAAHRFDVYRLQPTDIADAMLVVHLASGDALVRLPFTFPDVQLPDGV
jgi:hypothetical protein